MENWNSIDISIEAPPSVTFAALSSGQEGVAVVLPSTAIPAGKVFWRFRVDSSY